MKTVLSVVFITIFLVIGCKEDQTNEPQYPNGGSVKLTIDKINAPKEVVKVIAYLSRSEYETITAELNLLDLNNAEIFFNEIPIGIWHLKVDGLDSGSNVIYSGQTDIDVKEDQTVPVYLVLEPSTSGIGSIYLYVTWAQPGNDWFDHPANPILEKGNSGFDPYGVCNPFVMVDGDIYKMWYSGLSSNGKQYIFYATSSDGLIWENHGELPVIYPGANNEWDNASVIAGPVIKDNGIYKMYYTGFQDAYGVWSIGLAESSNGIDWTKRSSPILTGVLSWDMKIGASDIEKINDTYYLYYHGKTESNDYKIGVAISEDGYNFLRYDDDPILVATQLWESTGIYYASILKEGDLFMMVYVNGGTDPNAFGFAYSSDGLNWTKDENNPFFTVADMSTNGYRLSYPNLVKTNSEYRIYYTGWNESGDRTICLARKQL